MAKELPYFKFVPSDWANGDITLCSMETQGLFINLICLYWCRDCSISLAKAKQRFTFACADVSKCFEELFEHEVIHIDEDENLLIDFLDEQMEKFISVSATRSKAGSKGGKAKAKQKLSKCQANANIEEKRREEKRIVKKSDSKELEIAFDSLWNKYPKKEGRKQAFNHYKASLKHHKHEDIELAVNNYIKKLEQDGTENKYIKQGSTFFNNWEDYKTIDSTGFKTKGGKWDHLLD